MTLILRIACLLNILMTTCQAGVLIGCYKESLRGRHFGINPGDYSAEVMTIATCRGKCGSFKYTYAALSSGKFCFCANSLPDPSLNEANSNCDVSCAGDSSQFCGGLKHVSVYNTAERITGLTIITDAASDVVETGSPVNIDVSVDSGIGIVYRMDYGDGAGRTSPNVSGIMTRAYNTPGEYHILVYANDMNGTFEDQVASVAVRVDAPPGPVEVECDDPLATHEPGMCTVTVWSGSALNCDVTVAYTPPISYTLPIEDPPLSLAGPPIPSKQTQAGDNTQADYLMLASEFSQSGKILAWELYSQVAGDINMMILKPGCSDYCYSSNSCSGSCDSATQIVTTCSTDAFCMQYATCSDACSTVSRYNNFATTYEVTATVSLSVGTGYQYLLESGEVLVEPGYILGLSHNTGDAQLGRVTAASNEEDRSFAYNSPTTGYSFTVNSGSVLSIRHAIRAIASGGSKIHLPFTFETAGNYTLTATASSMNLGGSTPSSGSTVIRVLEGINATILDAPDFGITGENVGISIEPHSGNDVLYNWTFGSDEYLMITQSHKAHAFSSLGTYLINVTAYNSISSKSNSTMVMIEDKLLSLSISTSHTILNTPTVFSYSLLQGSNYSCKWNYGDGSAEGTTDELTTPLGSGTHEYTYSSTGEYTASVNCSNDVSYVTALQTFKVQEPITNLRLDKEGEDKDTDFQIVVLLDSGSEVTFTVLFDSSPLSVTQDSTYQWSSPMQAGRSPVSIPLEVTAENLVSNLSIYINFTILSRIVDPDLIIDVENVSSHTPVTFTVDVASGSDITVDIDYKDGNTDSYTQLTSEEWSTPYIFTHTFTMGGRFQVTATFSNAEGSYPVTRELLVLVGVGSINCVMEEYALYHPPAEVSLTLEGTTMPTEPTLTIDWESALYEPFKPPLVLNTLYNHTYGDTGVYNVTVNLSNLLGTKECVKRLTVVEKLDDPQFHNPLPKAAVGQPFEIRFCLLRGPSGDLCNLTYDYGEGSIPAGPDTVPRQGKDRLGCDSQLVTYNSNTPRNITVTARTPLETTNASFTLEFIDGATDAELDVTPDSDTNFEGLKTFTIEYTGSKASVVTTITTAFGDGSVSTKSFTFGTSSRTTTVTHTFTQDGLLTATFTIENEAFRVEKNVSVGVYKTFSNPTASIYYIAEKPPGAKLFGYKNNITFYPTGKDIWFAIEDDNNAYAATYELTITEPEGLQVTQTYSIPEINYTLTEPGNYTAIVKLRNPRNSVDTPEYSIETFQLIEGLSVTETQPKVQADEPKIFNVSFTSIGSHTCIYVDYGSGNARRQIFTDLKPNECQRSGYETAAHFNLSSVGQIQETYVKEGYYELHVDAVNRFSEMSTVIGFSITGLDCTKPSVDIANRKPYFNVPEEFLRSDRIKIRGLSRIECGQSYDNVKSWQIVKVDESYDTFQESINISSLVHTKAELNIPARFLKVGLYRITYTMTMQGDYGNNSFSSSIFTYIKIIPSPLVGIMVPGGNSKIRRGQAQTLVLDPKSLSLDPDVDPQKPDQGITVSGWECSLLKGGSDSGCDEILASEEKQTLDLSEMTLNEYIIKATLEKSGRTAETTIVLDVTFGSPPLVVIQHLEGSVVFQESDGYKVLKSSPLPLECICSTCSASDDPLYNWKISLEDYRWTDGWRLLTEQETSARVTAIDGKNSKIISIGAQLFEDFDSSLMQAECEITLGSDIGAVSTRLKVNSAPTPGICTVEPYNRTFTQDQAWTISVSGWSDDDGIGEYQFFIFTSEDEIERQITSKIPEDDNAFTIPVSLTEGYAYNNYEEEIFVKVRDSLGAINKYSCGKVIVRPIPLSEIQAFSETILTEKLNDINRLFAEADQASCTQQSIGLFSGLNSAKYAGYRMASSFANSKFGQTDVDRPSYQQINELMNDPEESYEMESDRNTRAEVRKDILEMLNRLETQSVIAIQQVSSCFAEALISSDEIVQETQNSVMDSLNAMHDYMSNATNLENVPPQDIEVFLQNSVSAVGGIMDASGSNGYFGTLSELAEAQDDQQFNEYDSSITAGDDIEMEQASTFDEALKLHTDRVHKKRQAHTAMVVRSKTAKALDKTVEIFNYMSVPSQEMEINTLKMKMKLTKSNEGNLKGETIKLANSDGGITLPNISFLANSLDSVIVSVSQSTNYPIRYTDFAEKRISNSTNFLTVNLYGEDNTKMTISNVSEPIKIVIPLDANAPRPNYSSIDPIITSWSNLMIFVSTINYAQSALFMDFGDLNGRQLLLVVKKGEEPKIASDPADDRCDSVYLMPKSTSEGLDDPFRYRFFLGSDFLGDFTGQLYIGVRELNSSELDMNLENGCASLPRYANGSNYFNGNFSLRQYVAQCLVIGDSDPDWSTNGCTVGRETYVNSTVCYCTHLTTFAGGWVVVPNTIDWSYVFANADFLDNPTIYVTQIVIVVLFILAAIYARFKDKELKEKLGIAPLADNDPKDKYFYEIVVCTGMRRNAGTDSQVCFILSGEDDETEVRAFSDSKRKIFRRGQIDGFLMSVPRPLGHLNFMRIWHDNSGKGKFGSWYLNYVIVSDVQTGVKQVFISNKWFAVEEDDGQVDRVIPVAGREQLADFSYQFGERTRKNLADGHLWFSVVARPPQSRFTCLQRVSCILCLLYVTMLANAMFYNTAQEDEQANNAFAFGPFSVSPEQIFIGVISNLIVFPVNFLLIFLFRKSRPHHKRPSRIDRAIKEVSDSSKQTSINDVKPEVSSIFSVSKTPTLPHDLRDPDSSRPCTAMSTTNDKTALQPKKGKKCELPWYFVIIAWILLWVVTLGAALMVTFYGISFKDETCKKWISSMLVSFFMSVFITQPIKVFLFAVILSLIIKNPGEEKEDEEDDEEIHNTHSDDVLLHEEDNVFGAARPRKIGYKPPDPAVLEKHRIRRMKEIKMWAIIREVIIYVFFLWILMVISYRQLGASHFLYKDTMHRVFIANNDTEIDFHKIRNTEEFWIWSKSGLINGLRSGSYYNDYPPLKLRAYVNDKVSRILGYATMRQLRIKPGLCEIPDEMKGIIDQCNVKYEILDQEEGTFRPGWLMMGQNDTVNDTREEYIYSHADSLNGYPYWGILSWYAGGGYVVPLKGSKEDLIQKMDDLQAEDWIDKYTRAVFVEFTVYNPQVNLFAIGTILAEFHPSGGMVQSFRFEPAMLLPYMDSAMLFQLVCEIVFLLFTLYFIIHEIRELLRKRLNYFKSFWNLIELGIISMSITAIVIFFYRLILTNDLTKTFKESKGNGYVKFQYVAYWNETFSYMIGMLVFFATLKFLKLLRFNKKITLLSATLNHSAKSLLHFSIIFGIVFLAFAQLFYLTYMNIDIDYSTFISSVVASVLMMMGKFNIYTMIMAEPILTQIFVLLFVVSVTFVIVNMFVSILNETFTTVREDIRKQGNDYEIVDFMVQSFRKWTGIGGAPKQDENTPRTDKKSDDPIPSAPDYVQDFPDRIDRLLQSISAVYTDNDNFAKMYRKQPFQSGASNPKGFLSMHSQVSSRTPDLDRRRRDSSDVIARVHTH